VATCTTAASGRVSVVTSDSGVEQQFFVAMLKDQFSGQCFVVLKGVVVGAVDEPTLTGGIGIPEQFAHDHGGYTLCPA
jgi:hypothetical protein